MNSAKVLTCNPAPPQSWRALNSGTVTFLAPTIVQAWPLRLRRRSIAIRASQGAVQQEKLQKQEQEQEQEQEQVESNEQQLERITNLAQQLVRQAGIMIQEKSGSALKVESKSSRTDLVTEIDKACEAFIHDEVKATFPKHIWLGEETVTDSQLDRLDDGPCSSEWTWIVDPIDGTLNFIGGVPFASVSIAVARGSTTEVGVIYNPFIDEIFVANRGHGAFLNGKRISVAPRDTELEDSIVTLGFTSKPERRVLMLEAITKVGPHCRAVRALGSAALHICYVAAARVGCFFELSLKPWDIAAAKLILEEAGGYMSGMDGEPVQPSGGSVLATNGGIIHDRLVQLLR